MTIIIIIIIIITNKQLLDEVFVISGIMAEADNINRDLDLIIVLLYFIFK